MALPFRFNIRVVPREKPRHKTVTVVGLGVKDASQLPDVSRGRAIDQQELPQSLATLRVTPLSYSYSYS